MTVSEIRDALETGEYDSVLDEFEARELEGENRSTALVAIDERR